MRWNIKTDLRCTGRLLAIAACTLLADPLLAAAEEVSPEAGGYFQCEAWNSVPGDRPGTQRRLYPVSFERGGRFRGRAIANGRIVTGTFLVRDGATLAFWSNPHGKVLTSQFSMPIDHVIEFYPDGLITPLALSAGRLESAPRLDEPFDRSDDASSPVQYIICPPKEATGRPVIKPLPPRGSLADLFPGESKEAGPTEESKSLMGLWAGNPNGPLPPRGKPTEGSSGKAAEPAAPPAESPKPLAPKDAPATRFPVCRADNLQPLVPLERTTLTSAQTVGLRNSQTEVAGSDYLAVSGDVFPLDLVFDVAESAGKLMPYEPIAAGAISAKPSDALWVSVRGIDGGRPKGSPPKPPITLRIIVVGGPEEIAVSGLNLVGTELHKQSRGRVRASVEWHMIDDAGSLRLIARYDSFEQLVNAAAETPPSGRLAALGERQVENFVDKFEQMLTSQTAAVDKIFWVKGAYPIPSSIPQRLERLIDAVSASPAVVRSPSGNVGKWLVVVTARMPGFSIAYLKEPIYSRQVGDVIDEPDRKIIGPRLLIGNPPLLAARLVAAATFRRGASGAADASPDVVKASGALVHAAKDLFDQRGYVLSSEGAAALRNEISQVSMLWERDGTAMKPVVLRNLISKSGKSSPSLAELLQTNGGGNLKLPKSLPEWARKGLKDLNATESFEAYSFVDKYLAGAKRLTEVFKKLETRRDHECALLFVTEELFGFARS